MADRVTIPEGLKKKQERDTKVAAQRSELRNKAKADRKVKRKEWMKRARKYAEEYATKERDTITQLRSAKKNGDFYIPDEPKVALVVRTKGIMNMNPDVKKCLQLLRLRQIHNAVFVKINSASVNMLRKVEPYITYGYPTLKTIRDLVYKRGHGKLNRQRFPLADNSVIEEVLGKHGIICVEDLIHEVFTCGPHFKEANNFLWPFKLSAPRRGYSNKRHPFQQGGDWGNREHLINEFVQRMNTGI
eukprot:CAMPEP_0115006418 /NCGR_PEP_ID=MMETSP0216-20121206/20495_1 /TAXON_ID=223996 /ORGANISM="Protocruzia adherens, Strain Boccale" /LENGTH=244 /DNA_ID=CAMNT_0002373011 /DNA_START=31 /DNA_END=765 /DNA_ORIENTATION=-